MCIRDSFGLSTQMAALAGCLLLGRPCAYLWLGVACGGALVPLELRRELLTRAGNPPRGSYV